MGSFITADPFEGSVSLSNPSSWNRYSYASADPANLFDPNGLEATCPQTEQVSYLYNGITYRTTTYYVCHNNDLFGYIRVYGNAAMGNTQTTYHYIGAQDIYESGACVTADGHNCAEEDLRRRFFAQLLPEPCTAAQRLNTPQDCGGLDEVAAAATPAFLAVRSLLVRAGMSVITAHMTAVQIVGSAAALYVSRLTGVAMNTGPGRLQWSINGTYRIPDLVDTFNKIAIEVKYVSEFRVTQQILDTAQAAMRNGFTYRIYLYSGATMSAQSQATLAALGVQVHRF